MSSEETVYHVCRAEDWEIAQVSGSYTGSEDDRRDGFVHFSTHSQARTSTAIHRAGQAGLVLLSVATRELGEALKWEPSRGGQLFPHLYGPLAVTAVVASTPLPLDDQDNHVFPQGFPLETG
jgi:uncharacterized protein (DUF952 family)